MKYLTSAEISITNPMEKLISIATFSADFSTRNLNMIDILLVEGGRDETRVRVMFFLGIFSGRYFIHAHLLVLKIASFIMNAFSFSQGTIPRGANHLRVELEAVNLAWRCFHSEHPVPWGVSTNFGSLLGTGVGSSAHDLHQNSENCP